MKESFSADIPQIKFQAAIIARMKAGKINPVLLSKATSIPARRLRAIMGAKPGAVLLSDLVALAVFFDISIDSFFR